MPRKISAKMPKLLPNVPAPNYSSKNSLVEKLLHIIWLLFKWAFVFSSETCINPLTWMIAIVLRGLMFYYILFPYQDTIFQYFSLPDGHTSIFFLPVGLFFLWYFLTSLLMLLGPMYGGFGNTSIQAEGKYSEFEKLADFANNKMKFQSYKDSINMLTGKDKK